MSSLRLQNRSSRDVRLAAVDFGLPRICIKIVASSSGTYSRKSLSIFSRPSREPAASGSAEILDGRRAVGCHVGPS